MEPLQKPKAANPIATQVFSDNFREEKILSSHQEGDVKTLDTRDFLILEHLPPSSSALRQKLSNILMSSEQWRAVVEEVDPQTGTYRLVVEGRLRGNRA